ncbi:MAG: TonB-dependent receptor [Pseudomonadota bacterium]
MTTHRGWVAVVLGLALDVGSSRAAEPTPPDTYTLAPITVTAERRQAPLQDVPGGVTSLPAEEIDARGLTDFNTYLGTVPGVAYQDRGAGRNTTIIRGINSGKDYQPLTATYFGEVPITTTLASPARGEPNLRLVDIDRVEVLRGPQGTLYGGLTMGGAVKLVPTAPKFGLTGTTLATGYSHTARGGDNDAVESSVNAPIGGDKAALRAVAYHYDDAGYITNVFPGAARSPVGGTETTGGRFALRAAATDRWEIGGTMAVQHVASDGLPQADTPGLSGVPATLRPYQQYRPFRGGAGDDIVLGNAVARYRGDDYTLTSSTAQISRDILLDRDISAATAFTLPARLTDNERSQRFVQELRVESPDEAEGHWHWQGGLFFSNQDQQYYEVGTTAGINTFVETRRYNERETAAYGDVAYRFLDAWTASAGLRVTHIGLHDDETTSGLLVGGTTSGANDAATDVVTPRVTLSYRPIEEQLFYATIADGFRPGILPELIPASCGVTAHATAPDTLRSYEIGSKSTLSDGRVTLDVAGYVIDWRDLQLLRPLTCGGTPFVQAVNTGAARSIGTEVALSARVTRALEITLSGAWTEATLRSDTPEVGGHRGDPMPGVPEFTLTAGAQYGFTIADRLNGFVRGDMSYVTAHQDYFGGQPELRAGNYALVNLRSGWSFGAWELALFVTT